ncbi:CU044_5270 family protein [Streptosporangium roseum]|uniref:CU044_5270 family protein n=1 Tax=Streptosporangium roseum TaxID=2001 RepID=UPI0004CDB886|nr:CU044_5270 family protein [Streptosporangium roseum]
MNEIELLKSLRDEIPRQSDLRAEEHRLLIEIREGSSASRRRPARPAARLRWGLALGGVGALAVAAAVAVPQLVAVPQPGGTAQPGNRQPAVGPPDAVVVLENAALVAARTRTADIRPDQWFYIKESQHMGGDLPTFEHWSRMDGLGSAIREEGGELKIGDGEPNARTDPARTQRELESLPTDPDALLEHFRNLKEERTPLSICRPDCPAGTEGDVRAFGAIGWYMKFGPVIPADKTAAMYRALAKIPNVTIEENTADGDGRKGIGVVLTVGESKGYYILDPGDYHYLGTKVVDADGAFAMSVLDSGVVDGPGQTP